LLVEDPVQKLGFRAALQLVHTSRRSAAAHTEQRLPCRLASRSLPDSAKGRDFFSRRLVSANAGLSHQRIHFQRAFPWALWQSQIASPIPTLWPCAGLDGHLELARVARLFKPRCLVSFSVAQLSCRKREVG